MVLTLSTGPSSELVPRTRQYRSVLGVWPADRFMQRNRLRSLSPGTFKHFPFKSRIGEVQRSTPIEGTIPGIDPHSESGRRSVFCDASGSESGPQTSQLGITVIYTCTLAGTCVGISHPWEV